MGKAAVTRSVCCVYMYQFRRLIIVGYISHIGVDFLRE